MDKDELIDRLGKHEWKDVEFKKAQRGVPEDAYETVSAFSNTAGGYLVFGIRDSHGVLEIVGVIEVGKVQNDFLSCLRSGDKLNRVIAVEERAVEHEGKTLLVFHVPEARRGEKPVYLQGDIRRSYVRRGGCDERCTQTEIERFLRDAAGTTHDREILEGFDPEECFDASSVVWYRQLLQERQGGRHGELRDVEFLNEWGLWSRRVNASYQRARRSLSSARHVASDRFCPEASWTISASIRSSANGHRTDAGMTASSSRRTSSEHGRRSWTSTCAWRRDPCMLVAEGALVRQQHAGVPLRRARQAVVNPGPRGRREA